MDEILTIKNLSKRYEDTSVLENINLSVKKGEVVVIVGPSGCGKSTLLRCLNGLEEIQEGEVLLDDEVVNPNKKNLSKNREKIGMVFQSYDLFPHLTILQNVTLAPIKVKKRDRAEVEKEALGLLERVGLLSKKDNYPRQLSGGQKQRVAIVRALSCIRKCCFSTRSPQHWIRRWCVKFSTLCLHWHRREEPWSLSHMRCSLQEQWQTVWYFLRAEKSWKRETRRNFSRLRKPIGSANFYRRLPMKADQRKNKRQSIEKTRHPIREIFSGVFFVSKGFVPGEMHTL